MPVEIERKFLVKNEEYKVNSRPVLFKQGYLSVESSRTVRVRIFEGKGFITIKGKAISFTRSEFEYEIPFDEAEFMLEHLCIRPVIEKVRHFLMFKGNEWVVDEFFGLNKGLIIAEIELVSEEQIFEKPDWISSEVTLDKRYSNSHLVKKPFVEW